MIRGEISNHDNCYTVVLHVHVVRTRSQVVRGSEKLEESGPRSINGIRSHDRAGGKRALYPLKPGYFSTPSDLVIFSGVFFFFFKAWTRSELLVFTPQKSAWDIVCNIV